MGLKFYRVVFPKSPKPKMSSPSKPEDSDSASRIGRSCSGSALSKICFKFSLDNDDISVVSTIDHVSSSSHETTNCTSYSGRTEVPRNNQKSEKDGYASVKHKLNKNGN